MSYQTPVTDADLNAYADGQLEPARRREVEQHLAQNPEAARRVADYQRLNDQLHALYDQMLEVPVLMQPRRPARGLRIAAAAAWLALGGLIGWFIHPTADEFGSPALALTANLVQPAAFAHYVYASEIHHPVEVSAKDEQHLVEWLSKRLRTTLRAPDLSAQGFQLVGGRLLPSTDRMAAQFMYQRSDGIRITLYARRASEDSGITAFRYADQDNIGVFYWIDAGLGYALSGELSKAELLNLAEAVYLQLT